MGEMELILNSVRQTDDCVSALEDTLGKRTVPKPHTTTAKNRARYTPPRRTHVSIAGRIGRFLHRTQPEPPEVRLISNQLRMKQRFLQETRGELLQLERSVDTLSQTVRTMRHRHD